MSLIITQTDGGLWTYSVDGLPCGVVWREREDCKRASIAFQNVIDKLGLGAPGYTVEVKPMKEAKHGIHKAD